MSNKKAKANGLPFINHDFCSLKLGKISVKDNHYYNFG